MEAWRVGLFCGSEAWKLRGLVGRRLTGFEVWKLGASRDFLGPSWDRLGAVLDALWATLGAFFHIIIKSVVLGLVLVDYRVSVARSAQCLVDHLRKTRDGDCYYLVEASH